MKQKKGNVTASQVTVLLCAVFLTGCGSKATEPCYCPVAPVPSAAIVESADLKYLNDLEDYFCNYYRAHDKSVYNTLHCE